MHCVRLANTLLKDEESARDNHVIACNFAKYLPTFKKITDRYFTVAESIGATYSNCWNTQGDISMPAGFRRHSVGKTLIYVCYCDVA